MSYDLLNSWKQIASYLNVGVRTAQRWEQKKGLPVSRLVNSQRGPVMAYRTELDAWLRSSLRHREPAKLYSAAGSAPS